MTEHPSDHEPHFLFLRQVRRTTDEGREATVDVFYCAGCLGRQEVLDSIDAPEPPRGRPTLRALGTAT